HRRRDREAEGFGGLEIDDELELGGVLDGKLRRLGAVQDLVDVRGRLPVQPIEVWSVGHEAAGLDIYAPKERRRQPRIHGDHGEPGEAGAADAYHWIADNPHCPCAPGGCGTDSSFEVVDTHDLERLDLNAARTR